MTFFARPSDWARSDRKAEPTWSGARGQHYFAFLSYSHRDEAMAKWLHDSLEKFRVPSALVGRLNDQGPVPRRLRPIFRDVGELAASDDLGSEIRDALAASRCLIILCSPAAAGSHWTNAEIEEFKRIRPDGCILAAIVAGEPFASEIPGREQEECLPAALRYHYDRRGRRTTKRAEPLAADLRGEGEAKRLGLLKLVAGMLGLGLDDLVQRETLRRQRRLGLVAAASLLGMLVTSGLAVTAVQARDEARDQRREAEGLIGFMLGDLKDKLQPIGKLDALDGLGSQVLAYYSRQDTAKLSDAGLVQRSRALSLMAEVATARGDLGGALRLYGEAMGGTVEAISRNPEDPQRLFDHAQNVFYVGQIARNRGDVAGTERALREYKRLAGRMVALEPDSMKWRMEAQYADYNLGVVLHDRRQFAESSTLFQQALESIEALATADPQNSEYQKGVSEALTWLADARFATGRVDDAIALRERHVSHLERLLAEGGNDVEYRQKLVVGHQRLGNVYAARGLNKPAEQNLRAAVRESARLMPIDVNNSKWREYGARVRLRFAEYLLATGNHVEAGHIGIVYWSACDWRLRAAGANRRSRLLRERSKLRRPSTAATGLATPTPWRRPTGFLAMSGSR
jgi:tetratricopeptide (TPR) repeat protein